MLRDGRVTHAGTTRTVMTAPIPAEVHGVECRMLRVPGSGLFAVRPMALPPDEARSR